MSEFPHAASASVPPLDGTPWSQAWQALIPHQQRLAGQRLSALFSTDPRRAERYSVSAAGLQLDYAKNRLDDPALAALLTLAKAAGLSDGIAAMFRGEPINPTEARPALHIALRGSFTDQADLAVNAEVDSTLARLEALVTSVANRDWRGFSDRPITDIVNIGIGGSDLGPVMATEALRPYHTGRFRSHFLANIDGADFERTLHGLDPATTLFIVASKSFGTLETRKNAEAARAWVLADSGDPAAVARHFVAVSANVAKAVAFGIDERQVFPLWDWVGGRYSLWSAIGLPIMFAIGVNGFRALQQGAQAMDSHFAQAELAHNMPVLLALLGIWYQNLWGARSQAILPYLHDLRRFPDFLQQLEMESNGKSCNLAGEPLAYHSAAVVWGTPGTLGQHSFHQLLHQGTQFIPVDFITALRAHHRVADHHHHLFANCVAQSQALLEGKSLEAATAELLQAGFDHEQARQLAPHKVIAGNRPSNMLLMEQLTPQTLGALIALYEHKVYVQSLIWRINAFDQWGVELGKQLSERISPLLIDGTLPLPDQFDGSTAALIRRYRSGLL